MIEGLVQRLLFANEAFYAAFAMRDYAAMKALWSAKDPVFCLHPGWPLLAGQEAVLRSWKDILSAPQASPIQMTAPVAQVIEGSGLVICYERIPNAVLAASNLFRLEEGEWRLFHHQAGPCQMPPEEVLDEEEPPSLQ